MHEAIVVFSRKGLFMTYIQSNHASIAQTFRDFAGVDVRTASSLIKQR